MLPWWQRAMAHLTATLEAFDLAEPEKADVMRFHEVLKPRIVEVP